MNKNPPQPKASSPPVDAEHTTVMHHRSRHDAKPVNGRFHLLVVDDEPDICQLIRDSLPDDTLDISVAGSLEQAHRISADQSIDLAIIDVKLPDGSGIDLSASIAHQHPACQTIVMTGQVSVDLPVAAMRAGAADFLAKPLDIDELSQRVRSAVKRRQRFARRGKRVRKLKQLVRKLDRDHQDTSQQIDILCKDLVGAYQDMAAQMQLMEKVGEFKAILRDELDLEQALRISLQFLLDQIGPTNAAIFLPGSSGGYSVGGYVNYTHQSEDPQILLDHMADVIAPRIADEPEAFHIHDNDLIEAWLGDDAAWMTNAHLMGVPCRDDERPMACVFVYRDADQPYTDDDLKLFNHIAPFFGKHLSRLVRVHHRMARFFEDDEPWKNGGESEYDDFDDHLGV